MDDYVLDHLAQIRVHFLRIIPVYPRDQIGTLADVHSVFVAPFDPLMVLIAFFILAPPRSRGVPASSLLLSPTSPRAMHRDDACAGALLGAHEAGLDVEVEAVALARVQPLKGQRSHHGIVRAKFGRSDDKFTTTPGQGARQRLAKQPVSRHASPHAQPRQARAIEGGE